VAVQKVFLVAESKGFKFYLELKEMIQNMFSAVGQTTIDENGFKVQGLAESSSDNRAMSNQRTWSCMSNRAMSNQRRTAT